MCIFVCFKLGLHSGFFTYWDNVFPLSKVDVLNQKSWHSLMVFVICIEDFPVTFTTHTDDISWPITGLKFMTGN